jgi:hypothetical protein
VGVVVAAIAIVVAVVLVATGRAPSGLSVRDLVLDGKPLTTARLSLTISDGGSYSLQGRVAVNFASDQFSATVAVPTLFSDTYFTAVYRDQQLLFGAPTLVSLLHSPWVEVSTEPISLNGLASDLLNPGGIIAAMAHQLGAYRLSHAGSFTTYHFAVPAATVTLPGDVPLTLPKEMAVVATITVGPAGQFAAATFAFSGPGRYMAVTTSVTAYDAPVSVPSPSASQVRPFSPAMRESVFGTTKGRINRLLTPAGIASLAGISISVPTTR